MKWKPKLKKKMELKKEIVTNPSGRLHLGQTKSGKKN